MGSTGDLKSFRGERGGRGWRNPGGAEETALEWTPSTARDAGAPAQKEGCLPLCPPPGRESHHHPFPVLPPTPEACKSHEPLSPSSHTFQSSSFLYSKTRDVSTGSRQARSPFSFLSSLPRESIFLNLILPETIWMKTAQEIQSGTKPSALIHLALSQPSASALKNPYSSGCHGPPGHRSKPCLHAEPHLPDISGTVNHLAVFSSSHPLSGPLVPLCSATQL